MKVAALTLIVLGLGSGNAIAQNASAIGPYTWVGYGRASSQPECYGNVFGAANSGLMPSNIYWNPRNGNCYGLEMVGKPSSPSTVGKYIGACYCPYNRNQNGQVCGLNSAYVVRNGQASQCFVNDLFRTRQY